MKQINRGNKDKTKEINSSITMEEMANKVKRPNKWKQNLEQPVIYDKNVVTNHSGGNSINNNRSDNLYSDRATNRQIFESS